MSGIENYNFDAFNEAAEKYRSKGWEVINPVDVCLKYKLESVLNDPIVFQAMISEEIELLKTCDAIYMMKGWEYSKGANIEYTIARKHQLKCYYQQNGIFRFLWRSLRDWAYER